MGDEIYRELASALDRLPNGFPPTPSGAEIPLLKWLFTAEEAALGARLTAERETPREIAGRIGADPDAVRRALRRMTKRGLVWMDPAGDVPRYRLAAFLVGIYESQLEVMDHQLAHLVDDYLADGGAAGIMGAGPALHRVVPARGATKTEWVLPYDDVRTLLATARSFQVRDCICRVHMAAAGERCAFPLRTCLVYSPSKRAPHPADISRTEALEILDQAEEVGLVHTVSNVEQGMIMPHAGGYLCNCCGCCCAVLRGITTWGIADSVARACYYAVIDEAACTGCGACATRCQVKAIELGDAAAVIARAKCIGCGLCVTGCPEGAVRLEPMAAGEIIRPPRDFAAWEAARRRNRERAQ